MDDVDLLLKQEKVIIELTKQLEQALDIIDDLQAQIVISTELALSYEDKYNNLMATLKGFSLLSGKKEKVIN